MGTTSVLIGVGLSGHRAGGLSGRRSIRLESRNVRWESDRRSNFSGLPAHLCAVTNITEISLNMMLATNLTQSDNV